jgi:site-specific DNA-methyltransferase (adenine-specific)
MTEPYYADDTVTLWHGDCRTVLPTLDAWFDCALADPPYQETPLPWDRWPDGWPAVVSRFTSSMWCFGSLRMFMERSREFDDWRFAQDAVWEKHNGTGFAKDRLRRVHEVAVHWYRGNWHHIHHEVPRVPVPAGTPKVNGKRADGLRQAPHLAGHGATQFTYDDDGTRLMRSVIHARSTHHRAIHPTEKPIELLDPLIRYACPPGGVVLDPFAGSGSTALAARLSGRRAVLIEADERYCEAIARRLSQNVLPIGENTDAA